MKPECNCIPYMTRCNELVCSFTEVGLYQYKYFIFFKRHCILKSKFTTWTNSIPKWKLKKRLRWATLPLKSHDCWIFHWPIIIIGKAYGWQIIISRNSGNTSDQPVGVWLLLIPNKKRTWGTCPNMHFLCKVQSFKGVGNFKFRGQ